MSGAVTSSDASWRPRRDRPVYLRSTDSPCLRENGAGAGDADVGRAARAHLGRGVNLATGREPERRITRARVFEIELDAHRAARHRHPAGDDCVEHTVQWRRIVVDDAVPDIAIAVHGYPVQMAPATISAKVRPNLEQRIKIGRH